MKPDIWKILSVCKDLVRPVVLDYISRVNEFPEISKVDKKYQKMLDFHREIVSDYPIRSGKYLRPSLVLTSCTAAGGDTKKAVKTAAAMQLSEEWILVHDDLEDDSEQRRGKAALHKIYGSGLAINAGDALQIAMWEVICELPKRIQREFVYLLKRTAFGQTAEITWTKENNLKMSIDDVLFILEGKTGYYTIAGPLRLGGIIAGLDENKLDKLYVLGKYLGFCFQIKDDLLDLTSDFGGQKKQIGNDIWEGKRTIMLVDLINKTNKEDKKKLIEIIGKNRGEKKIDEVEWVIMKIREYGSLEMAERMVLDYAKKAKEYLNTNINFWDDKGKKDMVNFIDFLVERQG